MMNRHTLDLQQLATAVDLGRTTAESLSVEDQERFLDKHLIKTITMSVLRDKIADDTYNHQYSYQVYGSPWQHFKALYMPKWFKDKYPVKFDTEIGQVDVKFERYDTYPYANVKIPPGSNFFVDVLGGESFIQDQINASLVNRETSMASIHDAINEATRQYGNRPKTVKITPESMHNLLKDLQPGEKLPFESIYGVKIKIDNSLPKGKFKLVYR